MSGFLGSYLHQIDDKGRLILPATFRRDAGDRPLVLLPVHADALTLYPQESWLEVEGRLRELLRRQPEARAHVLGLTARATEALPDKQGRILIPHRLLEGAGISGPALLVGALDRIEIWDPARFDTAVGQRSPEFERFVAQVFG